MGQNWLQSAYGIIHAIICQNVGPGNGNGVTAQCYIDEVVTHEIVPFFCHHGNHIFATR